MSKYKWYRNFIGGTWYLVSPGFCCPYISPFWTQKPMDWETIHKTEYYVDI